MARSAFAGSVLPLVASGLLLSACYTFRSHSSDRTNWDELPNDPRPELWVEGSPRVAVILDGVYSALGDQQPVFDSRSTAYYLRLLRHARIFTEVLDREPDPEPSPPPCRVRMERVFQEDAHSGANLTMAATVPGLLGFRFGLVATLKLELGRGRGAPVVYEARSRLTRIYYSSARMNDARLLVYREADRANTEAILHQLRADPDLYDPVTPLGGASHARAPAKP